MAIDFENPVVGKMTPANFLKLGKERTDAMLTLQKDLLDAYEQAIPGSRASNRRPTFGPDLAAKLAKASSAPDAVNGCSTNVGGPDLKQAGARS